MRRHEIGQARGVDLAGGPALVFPRPGDEGLRVLAAAAERNAPLVRQPPRLAALLRRAFLQQESRIPEHLLPQVLLLRRREEERQLLTQVAIERVLPQPLDERAEGQDVRRLPDRLALIDLKSIELGHQRLRQALVGRDHRDAGGVPLGGESREQVGFRQHGMPASYIDWPGNRPNNRKGER